MNNGRIDERDFQLTHTASVSSCHKEDAHMSCFVLQSPDELLNQECTELWSTVHMLLINLSISSLTLKSLVTLDEHLTGL